MNIDDDRKASTAARRASSSSPAVAVTTQEGVYGSREKAMIISSVEQTSSKGFMDMLEEFFH